MNKLILCTTGSSIANRCPSLRDVQAKPLPWDATLVELESELKQHLGQVDYHDDEQARHRLCAELNTLDRMQLESGDRVVLIATDTALGRVCSQFLQQILQELYSVQATVQRIEGLQVHDPDLLRQKGLKNLVKELLDNYLDNLDIRYRYEIIINPTGGYKAIVPFMTVLGMLYGKASVYLFEFANTLVKLPPLPFTFDLEVFRRVKPALEYMEEKTAITQAEFFSRIENFDQIESDLFLSFTEEIEDNQITLSPLAHILMKMDKEDISCQISDKALNVLEKIKGEQKNTIVQILDKLTNPLWRKQKTHRLNHSDAVFIKPGNTAERLAGFFEGNIFYVAMIYLNHDQYEKEGSRLQVSELKKLSYQPWQKEKTVELSTKVQTEDVGMTSDAAEAIKKQLLDAFESERKLLQDKQQQQLKREQERYKELENEYLDVLEENETLEKLLSNKNNLIVSLYRQLRSKHLSLVKLKTQLSKAMQRLQIWNRQRQQLASLKEKLSLLRKILPSKRS